MQKIMVMAAVVLSLVVMSCSDKSEADIEKLLEDEGVVKTEGEAIVNETDQNVSSSSVGKKESAKATSAASEKVEKSEPNIEKVKEFIRIGKYQAAIEAAGDPASHELKYYKGIAYYCMMKIDTYSKASRVNYRDNAISLLKEVGYDAISDELKAKALLWYGMAMHLNYKDLKNKRQAIGAFHRIQTTKLKDTKFNNDSLLYTAKVYQQMGWYIQAREFYKRLGRAGKIDSEVYNPWSQKYESISQASSEGLADLSRICNAATESAGVKTESKPAEVKTAETPKPAEEAVVAEEAPAPAAAPAPAPAVETKPAESLTSETKPAESLTGGDTLTGETKPAESLTGETKPAESLTGGDTLTGETKPAEQPKAETNLLEAF